MTRSLPHLQNERQLCFYNFWNCVVIHPVGSAFTVSHNGTIGRLSMEQWWWQHFYNVLKMSVNSESMIFCIAS
jgi:hypothetical protein